MALEHGKELQAKKLALEQDRELAQKLHKEPALEELGGLEQEPCVEWAMQSCVVLSGRQELEQPREQEQERS